MKMKTRRKVAETRRIFRMHFFSSENEKEISDKRVTNVIWSKKTKEEKRSIL